MFSQKASSKNSYHGPDAAEKPGGLYAHIPFCHTKCPYCSFVSYPELDTQILKNYMLALRHQAKKMAKHPWSSGREFHSLFIGGGTPTVIAPEALTSFIEECLTEFRFVDAGGRPPEVSIETNPNAIDREMLFRLRQAGVNRLSIGIQSFSDPMLHFLGRSHSSQEAMQAVEYARSSGFQNLSLDLMYGLPGQTVEIWQETLEMALELCPEHLSVYELTVEDGTPFDSMAKQGRLHLPGDDNVLLMFKLAQELLANKGYLQYEISNYSWPGFQCRHNINYWQNGSYLGLGAGAVSCFSGVRIKAVQEPMEFAGLINNNTYPYSEGEVLPFGARFRETVIMGLRMTEGVSCRDLDDRFGVTPQEYYGKVIKGFFEQSLLEEKGNRVRLTEKGLPVANQVLMQLV
jgi:oxygen-independent coproporphyrinogen-3 oxidase